MSNHKLERIKKKLWRCNCCLNEWESRPQIIGCIGAPQISYTDWKNGDLKSEWELNQMNLAPKAGVVPRAAYRTKDWDILPLYDPKDCEFTSRDEYLTKTQVMRVYELSKGWMKRLGEPDDYADNPYSKYTPIQLFSRKRIEAFLAENAEDYSNWLDRRDKYIAIFEQNKDKINAKRKQEKLCLKCASGCATSEGFLCAIHPLGLNIFPCPDWQERAK